jgi:hypothetical protein
MAEGQSANPRGVATVPAAPRWHTWLAIAFGSLGVLLGAAGLVVGLTRSTSGPATTTAPTYTAAETAAAQQQLCDTYKLAARAVQTETNGTDRALARIAVSNAAGMLEDAAANSALDAKHCDSARALATAYRTSNAVGSVGTDVEYRALIDDIVAKDAAMRRVCDGG